MHNYRFAAFPTLERSAAAHGLSSTLVLEHLRATQLFLNYMVSARKHGYPYPIIPRHRVSAIPISCLLAHRQAVKRQILIVDGEEFIALRSLD